MKAFLPREGSAPGKLILAILMLFVLTVPARAGQPVEYTRQSDFSDHTANYPDEPQNGTELDNEFNAVKTTLDEVLENIAIIQADDGGLNAVVDSDSFTPSALALMSGGFTPRGDWHASTAYAVGDLVNSGGVVYVCHTAHTSGVSIDVTKFVSWSSGNPTAAGTSFSPTGNISATNVQTALAELDTEKLATGVLLANKGTSVASATATALFGANSNFVDVTGTTTITSFNGTALSHVWVRFTGALTLTHNASSLILPSGANITTAAGDIAHFARDVSGNVTCLSYTRASGLPIGFIDEDSFATNSATLVPSQQSVKAYVDAQAVTPVLVKIATATASGSSNISFVNGSGGVVLDGTYNEYIIYARDIVPGTDNQPIYLRTSTNAGSSYDSGASDYGWADGTFEIETVPARGASGSTGDTEIELTPNGNLGSSTGEAWNCEIRIFNPAAVRDLQVVWACNGKMANGLPRKNDGIGYRKAQADVDAVRLFMGSGTIATGTFTLYGVK